MPTQEPIRLTMEQWTKNECMMQRYKYYRAIPVRLEQTAKSYCRLHRQIPQKHFSYWRACASLVAASCSPNDPNNILSKAVHHISCSLEYDRIRYKRIPSKNRTTTQSFRVLTCTHRTGTFHTCSNRSSTHNDELVADTESIER